MKKIILFFTISIFLFGCNDDILELTPLDRISESAVWNDENLLQAYVSAQYNVIQTGWADNLSHYTGEAHHHSLPGNMDGFRLNSISPSNVDIANVLNFWEDAYSYLYNINNFFSNIESSTVPESVKESLSGEMRFIRAYIYTTLLYSYGGVPIIDKVFDLNEELTGITRDNYEDVRDYILTDLNYIIANFPDQQTGSAAGRASADVARAVKSGLLLYDASALNNPSGDQNKWQAASDAAKELINSARYSLYPDYGELFLIDGNSEIIWQTYYTPEIGHNFPFQSSSPSHGGWGFLTPTQNLVDAYEMDNGEMPYLEDGSVNPASGFDPDQFWIDRDPRFYEVVSYPGFIFAGQEIVFYDGYKGNQDLTRTGYYNHKFLDPNAPIANTENFTTPWIHYRLAEIYLNYAEAEYHLGNESIAIEYVNKVRVRAGMPDLDESLSGEELLDKIYHERKIELVHENKTYYDIRRTKTAPEEMIIPIIGNSDGTPVSEDNTWVYHREELLPGFWKDKFYYTPIPYEEIQRSGGSLVQNPEWE